jgi:hypothetical protein
LEIRIGLTRRKPALTLVKRYLSWMKPLPIPIALKTVPYMKKVVTTTSQNTGR